MAMNCPTCGARVLDGANFCERCGLQFGIPPFKSSQLRPQPTKDNKVLWIVVIVVVIVVVVPIILSAVLYFMVLGFGGTDHEVPPGPVSVITKSTVTGGYKFTFAPISRDMQWGDVTILLSGGTYTATWAPPTTDLNTGSSVEWGGLPQMLGTLEVFSNVTDLQGNGRINQGDYFTLTLGTSQAFSTVTAYTVTIMHDPSSAAICHLDFQG